MKDLTKVRILGLIILFVLQAKAEQKIVEPAYTEDLAQFKDKKYLNARLEKVLGCWLYLKDYVSSNNQEQFSEKQWLFLQKSCMKKITRKDAVLKITQLGKRNMQPVTPLQSILDIQKQLYQLGSSSQPSLSSQFDLYLLQKSSQFKKQLEQINSKGDINSQIQEQLKKKQKYYFGFIPASMVNHTTILITLSMIMMCCCTWCRLYRAVDKRDEAKKKNNAKEDDDEPRVKSKNKNGSISRMGSSKANKSK